jgi:hypothetical protein
MTIDVEFILFALCMWASVATGLAFVNYRRAESNEYKLILMMMGIKRVAEGKAKLSLNADGSLKMEGTE